MLMTLKNYFLWILKLEFETFEMSFADVGKLLSKKYVKVSFFPLSIVLDPFLKVSNIN